MAWWPSALSTAGARTSPQRARWGQAGCADADADADGDGVASVVGLSFAAKLVRASERVPVGIVPLERDIVASGTHAVALTIGDDTRTVSVRARVR